MENENMNNNQDLNEKTESLDIITPEVEEQTPVAEPVVEEAPATEAVVEAAPVVEETPATEPVAEPAPVVEETPATEAVVEAAPVVEETPAAEPVVEAAPVVEETPATEPVVEAAPVVEETPAAEPTPVAEEVKPAEPIKVKTEKSKLPILLVIIVILSGAVFYLLYGDKLFKKEAKPVTPSTTTLAEYTSLNSTSYLRIKSDGTYELNLTSTSYPDATKVRDKKGQYNKSGETYNLDNGGLVTVYNGYVEITNLTGTEEVREEILFDTSKIADVKSQVSAEIKNYISTEQDKDKVFDVARAQVTDVTSEVKQCYRSATSAEALDKSTMVCEASYNIYLNDYNYDVCSSGKANNVKEGYQFWSWALPSGECQNEYVTRSSFFKVTPTDAYKVAEESTSPF